jgi:UDP-N-acetylglucosamine 3-dehydrogenase
VAEHLRVAVIGVGAMGAHHARVYGELPDAELVAIADRDEARLAPHDVRGYESYANMLAEEQLDAASIVVPTRLHQEIGLACIERGIAVLIEKPLAADVAEATRLRDAARSADAPLLVGHIERFNPAVVALKRHLDAREAGGILQVSAQRVGPFFPRERDVGVVHDLATHDLDVFRYLVGDIESVRAETQSGIKTTHEDALSAVVRFAGGAVGSLDVNWLSPVKTRELRVLCERGEYRLDYITQALSFHESGPPGVVAANDAGTEIDVQIEEPLHAELASFLRTARREEPPVVSADDAIATMRVVEAIIESARVGEPLAVEAS